MAHTGFCVKKVSFFLLSSYLSIKFLLSMLFLYYYRGKKTLFDGHGRSFGIKQSYKNGSVSWRCTCRSGRLVQSNCFATWGRIHLRVHTCMSKLDKSLHAQINAEVKVAVGLNKYATPHQIVEPILMEHFERDP